MSPFLTPIYGGVVSFVLGGVIGYLAKKLKSNMKESNALQSGLQALLRDRLLQGHRFYFEKGYMTISEKATYGALAEAYHNLGENGVMDDLVKDTLALPDEVEWKVMRKK